MGWRGQSPGGGLRQFPANARLSYGNLQSSKCTPEGAQIDRNLRWPHSCNGLCVNQTPVKEVHQPFVSDIQELRRRARRHMEEGAVTSAYTADRGTVIRILNEVLATEIVCVLRYKRHYYMATGIHAQAVAQEFLEHAKEEQGHADIAAERITQLGLSLIHIS